MAAEHSSEPTPRGDTTTEERDAALVSRTATLDLGGGPGDSGEAATPTRIGRFAILEWIGAGGMGMVFAAYDTQLDRKVAVKLLRQDSARDPDRARTRMVREAQAMARLSHPNVVQVYDAGTHEDQVFIAMEFIEGSTLRQWLREAKREWGEILGLFVQAGRGLAAAHRQGLIHRDFKPDNVLVDGDGQAKVTDFGMARAAGPPSTESTTVSASASESNSLAEAVVASASASGSAGGSGSGVPASVSSPGGSSALQLRITKTGALLGTPAYMSPEQFLRDTVDARSDQFSYCVALYEALFGRSPFEGTDPYSRAVSVTEGDPRPIPGSTRVPRQIRQAVLRGLSREPAERFPSMDDLLLALELRSARPIMWLAGAALVGGLGIAAAVAGQPGPCDETGDGLVGVWDEPSRAAVVAALEASSLPFAVDAARATAMTLDAYAAAWNDGHRDACEATSVRHTQSEALLDLRMACLEGRKRDLQALIEVLGEPDQEVVAEAPRAASRLPRVDACANTELLRQGPEAPRDEEIAGRVTAVDTLLARARALREAGRPADAEPVAERGLERAQRADHAPILAEAERELGLVRAATGDSAGAVKLLLDAVDTAEMSRHDELAADAWNDLTRLAPHDLGDPARGRAWARRAAAAVARIEDEGLRRAELLHNEGLLAFVEGNLDEAETDFRQALDLRVEHLGEAHMDVARTRGNLANVYAARGDTDRAVEIHEETLTAATSNLGPYHPDTALAHFNLAGLELERGRSDVAREHYAKAMKIYEGARDATGQGRVHIGLANLEAMTSNFEAALTHADAGMAALEKALPPGHPERTDPLLVRGSVLLELGRAGEAIEAYERALEIRRGALGEQHLDVAIVTVNLGEAQLALGQRADARENLSRALAVLEGPLPPDHELVTETRKLLSQAEQADLPR